MKFSIELKRDNIADKHRYLHFNLRDSGFLDLIIDDSFCYSEEIWNKYKEGIYNKVISIYNCNDLKEAMFGNSDMPYQVEIDEIIKVLRNFIYLKEDDERQQKEILFNNFFKFSLIERKGSEFIFDIELFTDSEGVEYNNIILKLNDIENVCEFLKEVIIELLIRVKPEECYDDLNYAKAPKELERILKKLEKEHRAEWSKENEKFITFIQVNGRRLVYLYCPLEYRDNVEYKKKLIDDTGFDKATTDFSNIFTGEFNG